MVSRRAAFLTPLALLAVLSRALGQDAATVVREGRHFRIAVHHDTTPSELVGRLAGEALAAVEGAWPTIDKLLQANAPKQVTLHFYLDEKAFRSVARTTQPGTPDVEQFGGENGLTGHVLLWPLLSERILDRVGLPQRTTQDLLFVAARAIAAQKLPPDGDPWLLDIVAFGVLEAIVNPRRLPGIDVQYDRRMLAMSCSRPTQAPDLLSIVRTRTVPTTRDELEVQSSGCAVIAQFLAEVDAGWVRKVVAKVKREGPGRIGALETVLGPAQDKTQNRFAQFCTELRPVWQATTPCFERRGDRWLLVGVDTRPAMVHAVAKPPVADYAIRATVEFGPADPGGWFRFELDREDLDMVAVQFEPDTVSLLRSSGNGEWRQAGRADVPNWTGRKIGVAIEVRRSEVQVMVDGAEAFRGEFSKRGMHGMWGLAAGACATWIEGLKIETLVPAKK